MSNFCLASARLSTHARMTPVSIKHFSARTSSTLARPLASQLHSVVRQKRLPIVCQASSELTPLTAETSKSKLRKCTKAQLVSYAQQMGVEHSGTKAVLVDRIHLTLSTDMTTLAVTVGGRQEEMQKLQAEVAQLDLKLAAVNEVLVEATEARENERQQLASVVADMSSMRHKWQTDVQQVEELAGVAGHLEQSERDILTLRSQQGRFEERIAMMQHLLEEREQEVLALKAQLSEFRQPVMAMANSAAADYSSMTWDSDTALAADPVRSSSYTNASWASDWNSAVTMSNNSSLAVAQAQPEAVGVLQPQLSAGTVRSRAHRQHTMPGLAIVAAVAAAAQRGGAAWDSLKSLLPKDKRSVADAILAAGATAVLCSMYT